MDPFLGAWTIKKWEKDSAGEIPANGFKKEGPLNITQPDSTVNSVDLQWENDNDQGCSVSGLQLQEAPDRLEGQNLTVSFAGDPVPCNLQVVLVPDTSRPTLTLTITSLTGSSAQGDTMVLPDVGGGVVTASSN
jgi:hypothetical protein